MIGYHDGMIGTWKGKNDQIADDVMTRRGHFDDQSPIKDQIPIIPQVPQGQTNGKF